jgi:hypothetical protein
MGEGTRQRLPNRRPHETFEFEHAGVRYSAGVGRFQESGAIAEVFLNVSGKAGSAIDVLARDSAVLASLCFQHGAAVDMVRHALVRNSDGSASSALGELLDRLSREPPADDEAASATRPPPCGPPPSADAVATSEPVS